MSLNSTPIQPTEFAGLIVDCDPSIEPEEVFGYDAFGNQVDPTIETEILRMIESFRDASRIDPTRLVVVRIHGRVIHSVTT